MSDESTKEYQLITNKLSEMQPLFDRMDKDEKLYLLDPYKMKKLPPHDSEEEEEVANITLNDPLLFATKAIAILGSYERQAVIKGQDLDDKKTTKIEEFLDDISYLVDEWLAKRGIVSLDAFINEQVCIRGRIVARSCVRLDGEGNVIPDILPVDARYFVYESAENGMVRGAPILTRSKEQVKREYDIDVSSHTVEVRDSWKAEKELIFIDGKIAKEQANPYGYPPFVVSICPIGSMFASKDALKHQGESIFWADRDLWKEKNRTATILQTLNIKALRGNLQYASEKGELAEKPEESPFGTDVIFPVEKGGGFQPMPINDIKNATRLFYSILEACLQRGELTPLDYGTLAFPLSSVAILNLIAARNDIFAPRLSAIASFYQALSRMIINQCVLTGKTIKLGRPGNQNTYSPSDFDGEYSIEYNFFLMSKEQTAADLALANSARGFLPDDYIRREMIKVPDPGGMKSQLEAEQAEKLDEVLFLFNRGVALLDKEKPSIGDQIGARILKDRIVTILEQRRKMGELSPIEKKEEPTSESQGKGLMPLFGGGGQGRPIKPQGTTGDQEAESGQ